MGNWHNVLRAIHMASGMFHGHCCRARTGADILPTAKFAKPSGDAATQDEPSEPLPQTLVRIPTEHAPALQAQAEAVEAAGAADESTAST